MGNCNDRLGRRPSYFQSPARRAAGKKPIFNVCLRVILPVLIWLTMMVMLVTFWLIWYTCNEVFWFDKKISHRGELDFPLVLQAEEKEYYYEVYNVVYKTSNASEYIAFRMSSEHLGEIEHREYDVYPPPITYWRGEYQILDLSQNDIVQDSYCLAEAEMPKLTQVKVYEFSAYKGYSIPVMSRGAGLMLGLMWVGELFIAGIAVLLDITAGLIIFAFNRFFYS